MASLITTLLRMAVGYGRVSTGSQDELLSVDTQESRIIQAAAALGFEILGMFRETGSGTSTVNRTEFLEMMAYVLNPANRIEAVWFYDPSRYTRDLVDFHVYLRQLTQAGIEVHAVTLGQYKPGDEASEMLWGVNALFNSLMPRQTARKTRDAQFEAVRKGYFIGRYAPFGYQKYTVTVGGVDHKKLEPNPETWDHARKMWEMGLANYTPRQVAAYNNSIGVRTTLGNIWTDKAVREFFRNPTYKGQTFRGKRQNSKLIPNGEELATCDNAHIAIVTPEEWQTVQDLIANRASAASGPRSHSSPNLLSSKVRCGLCGSSMHAQRRDDGIRWLICSTKKTLGISDCKMENVELEPVLNSVVAALLEKILTYETLEKQIAMVAQENATFLATHQTNLNQIRKAKTKAQRDLKNVLDHIQEMGGSRSLHERLTECESEVERLEAQGEELKDILSDHLTFLNDPQLIIENALDLRTYLESDDEQTARNFLNTFIAKVVIHGKNDGTIHWSVPLPSDGPNPASTRKIRFHRTRGSESYPLDMQMPNCRWAEVRPHSEEPEKYTKRVLGFLAEVEG